MVITLFPLLRYKVAINQCSNILWRFRTEHQQIFLTIMNNNDSDLQMNGQHNTRQLGITSESKLG